MERHSGGIFEGCSSDVDVGVEILFCGTSWSCFAHDPMESSDGAHVMLCKMSGEMRSQGGVIHLWGVLMWWIIPVRNYSECFGVNSVSLWLLTVSYGFLTTTLYFPVVLYLFSHASLYARDSSMSYMLQFFPQTLLTILRWWSKVAKTRKAVPRVASYHSGSALGCHLFEVRVGFCEFHNNFGHSKTTEVWSCILLSL